MNKPFVIIAASLLFSLTATTAGGQGVVRPNDCFEIIVVLDGEASSKELETAWGLSLLVRTPDTLLLFDTGPSGPKLLHNLRHLGVKPKDIKDVFISHWHRDHFGGLWGFLEENPTVEVHLPSQAPVGAKKRIERAGARVVVHGAGQGSDVGPRMRSTGSIGKGPPEQALVLESEGGSAVVTGCCHPGLEAVLSAASGPQKNDIEFVIGGLHLQNASSRQIQEQAQALKRHGVHRVIGLHCTGKKALRFFKKSLGENRVITRRAGESIRFCGRSSSRT